MANDKYSGSYNAGPQLPSYMKKNTTAAKRTAAQGTGHAKHGISGAHLRRGKAHNRGAYHRDPQHRDPQHGKPFFRKEQHGAQRRSTQLCNAQHSSAQHRSQGEYPARGGSSAA